jgi:hypothetical protein
MDINHLLGERGLLYGPFLGHATITQNIKAAMHNSANWDTLSPDQAEALDMIANKIGRILNGNPDYADSWVDIVGYAQLIIDRLVR